MIDFSKINLKTTAVNCVTDEEAYRLVEAASTQLPRVFTEWIELGDEYFPGDTIYAFYWDGKPGIELLCNSYNEEFATERGYKVITFEELNDMSIPEFGEISVSDVSVASLLGL